MDVWAKLVEVNIGRADRLLRTVFGLGLLVLVLAVPTQWGLFGIYPLVTGVFGTSPIYKLFGIYTTPKPRVSKLPPVVEA